MANFPREYFQDIHDVISAINCQKLKEKEKSAELYRLESSHEYFDSYELIFTRS